MSVKELKPLHVIDKRITVNMGVRAGLTAPHVVEGDKAAQRERDVVGGATG